MTSKGLQEFAEEVGERPSPTRRVIERMQQWVVGAPGRRTIVKSLGVFKHLHQPERWFWRPDGRLYKVPPRDTVKMQLPRRKAEFIAHYINPLVTIHFHDFDDGEDDCEATWENGVRISSPDIMACGVVWNRTPRIIGGPTLNRIPIECRKVVSCPGSGQQPVFIQQNSIIIRSKWGWAFENDRSDAFEGITIGICSFDSEFGANKMTVPLPPNGPPMNTQQAAYVHRVFQVLSLG